MTDNIIGFDFNGVKVVKDDNTELIQLKGNSVNGTITLTDTRDASQYQVPAGKKAHVIFIVDVNFVVGSLIYADDLDGTTNAVTLLDPSADLTNIIFISAEIPASKFVNITDNNIQAYEIYVVEESAT